MLSDLSYDFSAPFMAATIVAEDGERVPLWTSDRSLRLLRNNTARPFLSELTVKFTLANIPIITANLTPVYDDALRFLDSALIEWGTSKLDVQFGYSVGPNGAVLSPVFSGILLKPDISLGRDINITLNAQGLSVFNITSTTGLRFLRGTRHSIVERLLRGPDPQNPRRMELDDTEMRSAPAEIRAGWFENVVEIQQGGISDWQWILTLVWECRGAFFVLGDKLKVFARDSRATATPRRHFALGTFPGGQLGPGAHPLPIYPILSVSSPTMGVYLPGYLRGSVLQGVNSNTREVDRRVVNDSTVRMGRTGGGGVNGAPSAANPGASPQADGLEVFPGAPADQRVQEQVSAAQLDFAQRAGIRLELETLGIPDLLPGETISVSGMGRRIDGPNYMVFDVVHTVGGSGYTTKVTAYANVSETWTRSLPAEGQIPARTAAPLTGNQYRVELLTAEEYGSLTQVQGLPGDL